MDNRKTTIDRDTLKQLFAIMEKKKKANTSRPFSSIIVKTWLNMLLSHFNISYDNQKVLEYIEEYPLVPEEAFRDDPGHRNKKSQLENATKYLSVYTYLGPDNLKRYREHYGQSYGNRKRTWKDKGLGRHVYDQAVKCGVRINQEWVINKECWINLYPESFLEMFFNELDAELNLLYRNKRA